MDKIALTLFIIRKIQVLQQKQIYNSRAIILFSFLLDSVEKTEKYREIIEMLWI